MRKQTSFDPYHKWLGIPPKDQPPNYYRLIGLDLFETDADVIDIAANKNMTYLHGCSTGEHSDFAEELLNEIAAARLCLLDPKQKAEYDEKLKPPFRQISPPVEAFNASPKSSSVTQSSRLKKKSQTPLVIGGAVVSLAVVVVVGWHVLAGLGHQDQPGDVVKATGGNKALPVAQQSTDSLEVNYDFDLTADLTPHIDFLKNVKLQGTYDLGTESLRLGRVRPEGIGSLCTIDRFVGDFEMTVKYHLLKRSKRYNHMFCSLWDVRFSSFVEGDHKLSVKRSGDMLMFKIDLDEPSVVPLSSLRSNMDTVVMLGTNTNSAYPGRSELTIQRLTVKGTRSGTHPLILNEDDDKVKDVSNMKPLLMAVNLMDEKAIQESFTLRSTSPRGDTRGGKWKIVKTGLQLGGETTLASVKSFKGDFLMVMNYTRTGGSTKESIDAVKFKIWGHRFVSTRKGRHSIILCRKGDELLFAHGNDVPQKITLAEHQQHISSDVEVTMYHNRAYGNWPTMVIERLYVEGLVQE